MDDFQALSDRYLQWFKAAGGEFRDDLLQIVDLRPQAAGRGIIATRDIPEETTLFTIPRQAIINVLTSELPQKLPQVFDGSIDEMDDNAEPLDSWGQLILVMLYEVLQGDASRWKPYFDILPQQFDTPIFWSDGELLELQGTSLTAEKIGKVESDAMFRSKILPIVQANPAIFYPEGAVQPTEDELLHLAHRMGSTIMAYAFDLENDNENENEEDGWVEDREGRTMLGMVPMADTLNANAEFNAHINHGESLEATAIRADIKAGDQILNYYGPLPTSELLRRYGYVTPEHSRYDVVEVPWTLVKEVIVSSLSLSAEAWKQVESQIDDEEIEDYFVIERDSGEPGPDGRFSGPAVLREVSPELVEQLKEFLKAVKKLDSERIPDKRKRDEICDAVIAEVLKVRLAQYPTSIETDEKLLAEADLPARRRMAVVVRLGEKKLLLEAIALAHAKAQGSATGDDGEERASKKARV
ncbi:Ribosomal lysine N-methyltransferase 4 like protein [Verticillium longisporum]|nr:Ribosomal lysine N-methyltransferase 4 like protein [Verticillium longisporum]